MEEADVDHPTRAPSGPPRATGTVTLPMEFLLYVAELLERLGAYLVRSPLMPFLLQARRFLWREVGDDPRYEELIHRMHFPSAA